MLSRLVITFLSRSKRLLISWLQSPSAVIFEPPKIKSDTVSTVSLCISHEVMGPDAMRYLYICIYNFSHPLHPFTFDEHLGGFHILIIINKATKNSDVPIYIYFFALVFFYFFRYVPRSGIAGSYYILKFLHPKGDQSWMFMGRMMLKLKLQYFGHLMRRVDSLEKTLMLGGIEGRRRRRQQRMRWLMASPTGGTWVWVNSGS